MLRPRLTATCCCAWAQQPNGPRSRSGGLSCLVQRYTASASSNGTSAQPGDRRAPYVASRVTFASLNCEWRRAQELVLQVASSPRLISLASFPKTCGGVQGIIGSGKLVRQYAECLPTQRCRCTWPQVAGNSSPTCMNAGLEESLLKAGCDHDQVECGVRAVLQRCLTM